MIIEYLIWPPGVTDSTLVIKTEDPSSTLGEVEAVAINVYSMRYIHMYDSPSFFY